MRKGKEEKMWSQVMSSLGLMLGVGAWLCSVNFTSELCHTEARGPDYCAPISGSHRPSPSGSCIFLSVLGKVSKTSAKENSPVRKAGWWYSASKKRPGKGTKNLLRVTFGAWDAVLLLCWLQRFFLTWLPSWRDLYGTLQKKCPWGCGVHPRRFVSRSLFSLTCPSQRPRVPSHSLLSLFIAFNSFSPSQ